MKDPAFLFYSQDWIVGCQTLSMEERGQYITLISNMHQQGRMDEETIRLLVGYPSVRVLSKFDRDEQGFFYNKRLEKEILSRKTFVESRRSNGLKGGRPVKYDVIQTPITTRLPNRLAKDNLMEDVNENENSIEVKKKNKGVENFKKPKKDFSPPTISDVEQFFSENNYPKELANKVFHYYNDADWVDSKGAKVLNWKQKMRGVWFKPENSSKTAAGQNGFADSTIHPRFNP